MKTKKRILSLVVKKKWFEVMHTMEKPFEIRDQSRWMESRLFDKKTGKPREYDQIAYYCSYKSKRPYFICKYKGFLEIYNMDLTFSNGARLFFSNEKKYIIYNGEIIKKGNIKLLYLMH